MVAELPVSVLMLAMVTSPSCAGQRWSTCADWLLVANPPPRQIDTRVCSSGRRAIRQRASVNGQLHSGPLPPALAVHLQPASNGADALLLRRAAHGRRGVAGAQGNRCCWPGTADSRNGDMPLRAGGGVDRFLRRAVRPAFPLRQIHHSAPGTQCRRNRVQFQLVPITVERGPVIHHCCRWLRAPPIGAALSAAHGRVVSG